MDPALRSELTKWRTMVMLLTLLTSINCEGTAKLIMPARRHNKGEERKIDQVATHLPSLCIRNIEIVASIVRDPILGRSLTLPVQILACHVGGFAGNLEDSKYAEHHGAEFARTKGFAAIANPGTLGKVGGDRPDVQCTKVWLASGGKSYWGKIKGSKRDDILRM